MENFDLSEIVIIISSIAMAIATIFLAIITAVYVYLTWQLLQENKKMRNALNEPKVIAILDPYKVRLVELVIKNIGLGPAYNIFLKIEPDFICHSTKKLFSKHSFVQKGITYLAPNEEFRHFLNLVSEMKENGEGTIYDGSLTYEDVFSKKHSNTFIYDPFAKDDTSFIDRKDELLEILKKIQKDLHECLKKN